MSRYGPASAGGPSGGYEPPSDPWGDVASWEPDVPPPGYDPYRAAPSWSGPAPPPSPPTRPRRHVGLLIAVSLAVLLAAGGLATTVYLISGDDRPAAAPSPTPVAGGEGSGATRATTSSPDNLGLAAGFAQVGDCLVNDGTDEFPQMRITACDAGEESTVYQVLARFDETVADDNGARRVCGATAGYQYHYYFISEGTGGSFVLCMADVP